MEASQPEIGRWLWALEDTRQRTKIALEGLDKNQLDWTAPHSGLSIGTLLYHIAAIEMDWLSSDVLEEEAFPPDFDILFPHNVRDERQFLSQVKGESLTQHLNRLDAVRNYLLASFKQMDLSEFRRVRYFPDYDVSPEWVLHHLMQHEAEHRGQIGEIILLAKERS